MILRRFMKHVTDQNWFAVGLDVLVVITGIFLGMQVSEWNEKRQESQHEQFIISQLKEDFLASKELTIKSLTYKKEIIDDLYFVNKVVQSGTLKEADQERFYRGYYLHNVMRGIEVVMGTYSSLVAAGEFNIIQDEVLRKMLLTFDARIEKDRSLID